jgi:hypothetical protein
MKLPLKSFNSIIMVGFRVSVRSPATSSTCIVNPRFLIQMPSNICQPWAYHVINTHLVPSFRTLLS